MRVIENQRYRRRAALTAGAWRAVQSVAARALEAFQSAWSQAFPMPPFPTGPDEPPPIAKAAAMREPALLAERIDAVSVKKAG